MKRVLIGVLTVAALFGSAGSVFVVSEAFATISDDEVCWDPDVESPVECDYDD
jgi:hypothetical protein